MFAQRVNFTMSSEMPFQMDTSDTLETQSANHSNGRPSQRASSRKSILLLATEFKASAIDRRKRITKLENDMSRAKKLLLNWGRRFKELGEKIRSKENEIKSIKAELKKVKNEAVEKSDESSDEG